MKIAMVLFLIMSIVLLETAMAGSDVCDSKCGVRCSKAGVKDRCLKYCGICCKLCNECVPSGTYGNKHECPCYNNLKNPKGTSKCP